MNILVTGGAGFIGSHLARVLASAGERVTILDNLDPQVHGRRPRPVRRPGVRFVRADVRDRAKLARELRRADAVVHFAAALGVGQSQYRVRHFVDVNVSGTAALLELLADGNHSVKRILLAGSMTPYGEGACRCGKCGRVRPPLRTRSAVRGGRWAPACPRCGRSLRPLPTRETDPFSCTSVYAVTKMAQEELVLALGAAYGIPAVALRFFNVYGPGQSLSNPYTGVAAIFLARLLQGRPPVIYEDGLQTRDFVSVHDVVRACRLALRRKAAVGHAINVGTGKATRLIDLARRLARACGSPIRPKVLHRFRSGDVRHCTADIARARRLLGYRPTVSLADGLDELVAWSATASARDMFERAQRELSRRGLA